VTLQLTTKAFFRVTSWPRKTTQLLWQLRQLRLVRSLPTSDTTKTLVHAFISSCLDYCNSLLYGVGDSSLKKLQGVQNAAALVVTTSRRYFVHFTGFRSASWLWQCLHGLAPTHSVDDCLVISAIADRRHLRSDHTGLLSVPRTPTTLVMSGFVVTGPVIWNSLPATLRTTTLSPASFAQHLKAHLCGWSAMCLGHALQIHSSSQKIWLPNIYTSNTGSGINSQHCSMKVAQ